MAEEKTIKVNKKRWYQIVGPKTFRESVLGETLVTNPQLMIGKTLKINLMNLIHDVKQQNVNIKFEINEIRGERALSEVIGYEMIPATIRRLVRRGKRRNDISFLCETSDNKKIRVKSLVITKKTMKSSVTAAIRKSIVDYLMHNIKKTSYDDLVTGLVSHRVQHSLRDHLKKIYPLKICEIREMSIVKKVSPEEKVQGMKEIKKEKKEETREENKKEDVKVEKPKEASKERKEEPK